MLIDLSKSLAELTGTDWGLPPSDCGEMVRLRHQLRRTALSSVTDEELARLIEIGVVP